MDDISNEIIENTRRFLKALIAHGFHIDKAVLFGSYAKGNADRWSDIDIALVSRDFTGVGFHDRQKVNPFLIKIDSRIEPHPFRPEDFTEDNPFVKEILTEGVEIH